MQRAVHATAPIRASFDRAKAVLVSEVAAILGDEPGVRDRRTFLANLAVTVGKGGSSVHQRVEVHLKGVHLDARSARWDLEWHAVGHPHLFPVLQGVLTLEPREIHAVVLLHGTYQPPLGVVGAVGDSVAGQRVARQSVSEYLQRVARRINEAVDTEYAAVAWHPAPCATREPGVRSVSGVVRSRPIEAATELGVPFAAASDALLRDLPALLRDEPGTGGPIVAELAADLGRGVVHQRIDIRVRTVHVDDGSVWCDLSWRALDHPRLFPIFRGRLVLAPGPLCGVLRLTGAYEPPLWVVGRFGDGLVGHRLARQSLETYLGRVGTRLAEALDGGLVAAASRSKRGRSPSDAAARALRARVSRASWSVPSIRASETIWSARIIPAGRRRE